MKPERPPDIDHYFIPPPNREQKEAFEKINARFDAPLAAMDREEARLRKAVEKRELLRETVA